MAVFMSEKVELKAKNIMKEIKGHFSKIKGSHHQENITILKFIHLITEFQKK